MDDNRFTEDQMLDLAASAIRKIDRVGFRGVTMVTYQEIEAMALTLVSLGMKSIPSKNGGARE